MTDSLFFKINIFLYVQGDQKLCYSVIDVTKILLKFYDFYDIFSITLLVCKFWPYLCGYLLVFWLTF